MSMFCNLRNKDIVGGADTYALPRIIQGFFKPKGILAQFGFLNRNKVSFKKYFLNL